VPLFEITDWTPATQPAPEGAPTDVKPATEPKPAADYASMKTDPIEPKPKSKPKLAGIKDDDMDYSFPF
jgi:hypothetical protein